jgi:hypothetical protein
MLPFGKQYIGLAASGLDEASARDVKEIIA